MYRDGRSILFSNARNCGDVFTAETAEGAEVFGQDRRDIVMSIRHSVVLPSFRPFRTPLEFRRKKGRKGFAPFSYVIVLDAD